MTLSFSETINGRPTYFIEKIWAALINHNDDISINHYEEYLNAHISLFNKDFGYNEMMIAPKLHTIREDASKRWREGMDIHFVINNRTKDRFQFAPVLKCKSIQYISIPYVDDYPIVHIGDTMESSMPFYWENPNDNEDGYGVEQMKELAMNDGFNSIEDFFKYFDSDFTGKIIHWTNKSY